MRSMSVTIYGLMSQIENYSDNESYLSGTKTPLHAEINCYKTTGTPSSMGCTHLGKYTDRIYYDVMVTAGLGTRAIFY